MTEDRENQASEETEPREPDAADPGGAYGNAPGRTGSPPADGPDHPADETVPTPGP